MQRSLAYALSPSPRLPLGFLFAAPCFGVLAALMLFAAGDNALDSRWSTPLIGAVHLITLGYLGMAMAGSMLQLITVVAGREIVVSRSFAFLSWLLLALGAVLLAIALAANIAALFVPAASLLVLAFLMLLATIVPALAGKPQAGALPMVGGMRVAVAGLVVTVALGAALALSFGGLIALPVLQVADLHAAWGLVGWVAMLVVGVAFQVIPMFQSSTLYPAAMARLAPSTLVALLAGWTALSVLAPSLANPAGALVALALAAFALLTGWMIAQRKRKELDATTLYWRLSLGCLCGACLLYLLPLAGDWSIDIGILFIGGFALGVVNGMLYKIVPFLLWYHLQHDPRARKGDVPPLRSIISEPAARRQFWCYSAALALLLGAAYAPALLARPAFALFGVASLLLVRDLWQAGWHCRRIQRSLQPS